MTGIFQSEWLPRGIQPLTGAALLLIPVSAATQDPTAVTVADLDGLEVSDRIACVGAPTREEAGWSLNLDEIGSATLDEPTYGIYLAVAAGASDANRLLVGFAEGYQESGLLEPSFDDGFVFLPFENRVGLTDVVEGGGIEINKADPTRPVLQVTATSLPEGGTTNQVLAKLSDGNGDADWVNPTGGGSAPSGGTEGQALVKASDSDGDVEWGSVSAAFVDVGGTPAMEYFAAMGSISERVQNDAWRQPVRAVATTNVASLSGEQTIDGVDLVDGERVLLTGQTDPADNRIYTVHAGAWTADGGVTPGATVRVGPESGSHPDSQWVITNADAGVGNPVTWTKATGGGGSGDVVGPASSVDGRFALFDSTTGKLLKQASVGLADLAQQYHQSTAPSSGVVDGSTWVDSDDGSFYVRLSGAWVQVGA